MYLWLDLYSIKIYKTYFGKNERDFDMNQVLDDIRELLIWWEYKVNIVM